MRSLRSKLSYANVISTLCLFMLLGGGAYAASRLPAKNSVGAKQLKNGAVTGAKIKKANDRIDQADPARVADPEGSRRAERRRRARKGTGRRGPKGAQGSQGEPGDPGSYATVLASIPPKFHGAHPGFLAVERFPAATEEEDGIYCLTPEPSISIAHPIAAADGKISSAWPSSSTPMRTMA